MSLAQAKRFLRRSAAQPQIRRVAYLLAFQVTIATLTHSANLFWVSHTYVAENPNRWWFTTLIVLSSSTAAYFASHYRVRNIGALEQVRTSLASDLHDEIGSGLAEIAIWAELARQGKTVAHLDPLAHVSESARNLRDSMSDIVWAVDPLRDRAGDLISRMRQSALVLLEPGGCDVRFEWTKGKELALLEIGSERRRHILLIYKEAVVNVARHSGAGAAIIQVGVDRDKFQFTIGDNGRGFDPETSFQGHGLRSMRLRADQIGGKLEIESNSGGTLVRFTAAVRGASRMNMRSARPQYQHVA